MYIFLECAACLILVAFAVTLLCAGYALLIILDEGAAVLGRLGCKLAHDVRIFAARRAGFIRSRLSVAGFGLRLNQQEDVAVSRRFPCSR